jgi:hypothetical protein
VPLLPPMRSFVDPVSQPPGNLIGKIDVAWRAQIVAGNEDGLNGAGPLVGYLVPHSSPEHDGMAAIPAVRGGDDVAGPLPPRLDHAVDRGGREIRAVGENDHGPLDLCTESPQPAAQRGAHPALPVRAVDDSGIHVERVRSGDDDEVVSGARPDRGEHVGKEQLLLRAAEPAPRTGGEHDGRDHLET